MCLAVKAMRMAQYVPSCQCTPSGKAIDGCSAELSDPWMGRGRPWALLANAMPIIHLPGAWPVANEPGYGQWGSIIQQTDQTCDNRTKNQDYTI